MDESGILMVWDIKKGLVVHTFNSSQKSIFHVARWNSQILFVAYCKENAVMFESINMELNTHETRTEHIIIDQDIRSPNNYPTTVSIKDYQYKSK